MEANGTNSTQLLTAALGLTAEAGEFTEVVKKIVFQGKPYNEENVFHMKRELGDICWYLAQACMALDTTFDEVIEMNVEKLQARYPGGSFDVHSSENRVEGRLVNRIVVFTDPYCGPCGMVKRYFANMKDERGKGHLK